MLPVKGEVVFWTLRETEVERARLERIFEECGLPKEWMPSSVRGRKAFREALRAVERMERDLLVRKILEDEERIVYGFVREVPDTRDLELEYDNVDAIIFHKDDQTISFKVGARTDVRGLFEKYLVTYTSDDLRRMLVDILVNRLGALTLRETGGVYFVPAPQREWLDKIEDMVERVSGRLYRIEVVDREKTGPSLFAIWYAGAKEEVVRAIEDLERIAERMVEGDVPSRTLASKIKEVRALREKVEMYIDLFEFKAEELRSLVAKLDETARRMLGA